MAIAAQTNSQQAFVPMVKDEANTVAPAASDLATAIALVNDLRRIMLNLNLAK